MGVHQTTVSQWEKGASKPRPARLRELEQLLGTRPGELMEAAGYVAVYEREGRPVELRESAPDAERIAERMGRISAYGKLSPAHRAAVDSLITSLLEAEGLDPDNPDVNG